MRDLAKVLCSHLLFEESGCVTYTGTIDNKGYGVLWTGEKNVKAHRVAYELLRGPLAGQPLDHACHTADLSCPGGRSCRHRRCVNPQHLRPMSLIENVMLGQSAPAVNARKTHCKRGHEFTPENTLRSAGERICRTCKRERERLRRLRLKGCPDVHGVNRLREEADRGMD